MKKEIRIEGEYPFYPTPPEHEVMKQYTTMEVVNQETNEVRMTIDYGNAVSKSFQ